MENIGLNNDVSVGGRKFHVQTSYSPSGKSVVANVFHDGVVIDSKEIGMDAEVEDAEAREFVKEVHQELITEMEILYYIYEKVKAVRHAPSANKLGQLFLQKSLYEEAIEQFNLALEIEPGFSEALANLGKALLMTDAYDEAVETLNKGAGLAPDYADIQNYLGIAQLYKEQYSAAVAHLEKAIVLNPNYIGAHYHLGIALLANSLTGSEQDDSARDRALEHLRQASERMVNRKIDNFERVMKKVDDGELESAIDEFLLSKPREVLAHFVNVENEFYLKFMYGGKGKDDSFISDYVGKLRDILDEHPDYADVRNNLGIANLIQCRNLFLKALDEFRAALKINPDFKKAAKNLKLAENDGKGFLILLRAILK